MNPYVAAVVAGFVFVNASQAGSEDGPIVVELFTSQGCSSCPPADALLSELSRRPGIIALSLHVDYWDYLGWKDTLGSPSHADRQRAYARASGSRTLYTPQLVVNGRDMIAGSDPAEVAHSLATVDPAHGPELTLERHGARLTIAISAGDRSSAQSVVHLVRYLPWTEVRIERGENAGRAFVYTNSVTDWQQLGVWDGRGSVVINTAVDGDEPAAVLIQEDGPGRIIAAALAP